MSGFFGRVSRQFRRIASAVGEAQDGSATGEAKDIATNVRTLTRDGDIHVLVHAGHQDKTKRWCRAGLRVIQPPDVAPKFQASFGIDQMNYALEEDFAVQVQVLESAIAALAQHRPDLEAGETLRDQLEQSFTRIRQRWAENASDGYSIERFSIYQDYKAKLTLAIPSTAMGEAEIVGAEFNDHQQKFRRLFRANPKNLRPVSQEVLAEMPHLSGHEKLQLLEGEKTDALKAARTVFEDERTLGHHVYDSCLGYPGHDATGWLGDNRGSEAWHGGVVFANGDSASVSTSQGWSELARSYIASRNLRIQIGWKRETLAPDFRGGYGSKGRFPSIEDMNDSFRTLFERMVILDPEWPDWILEIATGPLDRDHPTVVGLDIPPRHQGVIAWILQQGYARQVRLTESFMAKQAKTSANTEAASNQPDTLADGAMFGDIKTENLEFFEKAKVTRNARTFLVETVSDASDKRRKRGLTYLWGGGGTRPLTPKQIARLTRYTSPDALYLMPDHLLGRERRDVIEAAFRISFDLPAGAKNPFLDGWETIVHHPIPNDHHELRITLIEETEGYALTAFSIADELLRRSGNVALSTGAGVYLLTTPSGSKSWVRPSFIGEKSHLPPRERAWLTDAIEKAFPLDPELADEMKAILVREWDRLSETYPET